MAGLVTAFLAVAALAALPALAGTGMATVFGIYIPYVAVAIFVAGFIKKVLDWASSPVPFAIPTTGGQQYSMPWIKQSKFDNPSTPGQTFIRMALEVLCFRSLFRNTKVDVRADEGRVGHGSDKSLWLFALMFHYCFLIVFIRHFRFFLDPVPFVITGVEFVDSILQIGVPTLYLTDVFFVVGVTFLLARRIFDNKVNYISLIQDYFPLFLILAIALSGIYMRYIAKVDVIAIKQLAIGLVSFNPVIPPNIDWSFYMHFFLVCVLWAYFPFSKLMHLGGVFLSPTRNLPNDTRMHRHINPWNDPSIKPHSYEDYENDFREKMIEAGLPVDKEA
jgi:nitrate reductase gamma subunit